MNTQKDIEVKRTPLEYIAMQDVRTNPFGQNVSADHAFKRTERILAALYVLTNAVPESEPIRIDVRDAGHKLLSRVLSLRSGFRMESDRQVEEVSALVREIISFAKMLTVGGYISASNSEILVSALDELGQFVASARRSYLAEKTIINKKDLVPERSHVVPISQSEKTELVPPKGKKTLKTRSKSGNPRKKAAQRTHQARRAVITDVLKRGGKLSIKDISAQVVDCSEKTIQRELAALVGDGTIRADGNKRWRMYSLA